MSQQLRSRNVGYHRRKKNQLLQFIQKIVVGQFFCSIGCVERHCSKKEQVPAPLHSTESTEPKVIPEPAKLLKDADERMVPHVIWAGQHGCQRLVVMLTDTVIRLLHFNHTLVRDNLEKPLGRVWDK